jgi:hypothetical protein
VTHVRPRVVHAVDNCCPAAHIVCTTLPQFVIADLTLRLNMTVGEQSPLASVDFAYYFVTSFGPHFGPSSNATLTVAGGGFSSQFTPTLRLTSVGIGNAAVYTGRVVNNATLSFVVKQLLPFGSSAVYTVATTLNDVDMTAPTEPLYTAYFTAAENASIVSGPLTGGTPVSIAGECVCVCDSHTRVHVCAVCLSAPPTSVCTGFYYNTSSIEVRLGEYPVLQIAKPVPLTQLDFITPVVNSTGTMAVLVSVDTGSAGPKVLTVANNTFMFYPVPSISSIYPSLGSLVRCKWQGRRTAL